MILLSPLVQAVIAEILREVNDLISGHICCEVFLTAG